MQFAVCFFKTLLSDLDIFWLGRTFIHEQSYTTVNKLLSEL